MEFLKSFTQALDPVKVIDQTEQQVLTALAYVQPAELSSAMKKLTQANAEFARANLAAVKLVAEMAKDSAAKFGQSLSK
jgi:cellobiose-specific phosphotransferase system component IIA